MHLLVRLFVLALILGAAMQQGWLAAVTGSVVELLGGPATSVTGIDLLLRVDVMALLRRLGDAAGALPEPWHSLAWITGGIIALLVAASVVSGLVRGLSRLTGWLRDAVV